MNYLVHNLDTSFKLELFFELSPDLLCIAGYDGYFKKINPAVSKLLGYSNKELYARPINDFVHEEDKHITNSVRGELTKNTPLNNFENRYITKNGEVVWLSWTSLPNDDNQLIFAIAKNITHKKIQEEDRNTHLTSLTKVNKSIKQATFRTVHDLRSPVNNLLAIFNLLEHANVTDLKTIELINLLKLASEDLHLTLNNNLADLIKHDGLNEQIEKLSLKESLDSITTSIKALIQTSKATIHFDFSAFEVIHFNKAYLESIFLNLITNSIKYARPDCYPIISISTKQIHNQKQLIISDNGLGFDMETVKDKVFGLNQKFHDHGDGKGIGLYLVFNHITNLGGRISLDSKVNEGSTFTISFKS
jgi:PAS domain S-box-containing protein